MTTSTSVHDARHCGLSLGALALAFLAGCAPGSAEDGGTRVERRTTNLEEALTRVDPERIEASLTAPVAAARLHDRPARYVIRDRGVSVFFAPSEIAFAIAVPGQGSWRLFWRAESGRVVEPRAEGELAGRVHWLVGPESEWVRELPTYERVVYDELWPGIALVVEPRRRAIAYRSF